MSAEQRPDVVLMDVRMPVLDGIEATRHIAAADEEGGPRILILTTFDLDDYVYDALQAGASGFLLKDVPAETLFEAVRVIAGGEALLAPTVTRRLIAEFARMRPRQVRPEALSALTPRETEILGLVAEGPLQSRDRGSVGAERRDGEDPREPRAAQARVARPRTGGRRRLRVGSRRSSSVVRHCTGAATSSLRSSTARAADSQSADRVRHLSEAPARPRHQLVAEPAKVDAPAGGRRDGRTWVQFRTVSIRRPWPRGEARGATREQRPLRTPLAVSPCHTDERKRRIAK